MQRALLQYFKPENHDIVEKALIMAKRRDLIGTGKDCLIAPSPQRQPQRGGQGRNNAKQPARNSAHSSNRTNSPNVHERGKPNGRKTSPPKSKKHVGKPRG